MTQKWVLTPEQKAHLAAEWARGVDQTRLADRYGVTNGPVSNAIGEFVRMAFPQSWAQGEERRKLAKVAAAVWLERGRVFAQPPLYSQPPPRPRQHRPIDMGGPRDVWLEFYPPPDPRLDNMVPVSASEIG